MRWRRDRWTCDARRVRHGYRSAVHSSTPDNIEKWGYLTPVNVDEQLELPSDKAAGELLDLCAAAVIEGVLPAEPALSGDPEPWRSALLKSAAHREVRLTPNKPRSAALLVGWLPT